MTEEADAPCPPHCCCCGPGDECCDCGEIMPADYPDATGEQEAIEQFREIYRELANDCVNKRDRDSFIALAELSDEGILETMKAFAVALSEGELALLKSFIEPQGKLQ